MIQITQFSRVTLLHQTLILCLGSFFDPGSDMSFFGLMERSLGSLHVHSCQGIKISNSPLGKPPIFWQFFSAGACARLGVSLGSHKYSSKFGWLFGSLILSHSQMDVVEKNMKKWVGNE